jgi:Protein of unknown function (DUF3142)
MDDGRSNPPVADTTTRRLTGVLVIIVSVAIALLTAGFWPEEKAPVFTPLAGVPIDYWDWGANRLLSDRELAQLDRLGSREVYSLCGFIRATTPTPTWEPEGRASSPIPGKRQHLVVRIDATLAKQMDPALSPILIPIILSGWERNRTKATVGLQIDCDVPTKKLPAYIEFLRELRLALPADLHLSITMLIDWIHSRDLAELMHVVDLVAPQFYNTYVPFDPTGNTPLIGAQDLDWAIAKLEAVGRPYRIGLPTYEQCSLYAKDGTLLKPAITLSPEQALTAGGISTAVYHRHEHIIIVRFPRAVKCGGYSFEAEQRVAFAGATPQGLAGELATIRRLKPQFCQGVLLFRLPGREATKSLSIDQVVAAAANTVSPAQIVPRIQPLGNDHYALIVSNQGDSNFIDFTTPVRILIHAPNAVIKPTLLPTYGFAIAKPITLHTTAKEPDGLELYLGLLRAGEMIKIEDMQIIRADRKKALIQGTISRGSWSDKF